ncbi:rhombosortase [Pseudomaricurvus alcaniphilus]|uniref:rhombosortase n=1 Tax=Pseudomaricurvus alcaniphilus TaxID=1166482 RepID=UPI001407CAD9|nr:rhombosortase [Pseudomaricurvus alcaniphilus]NHN39058.1 rhombosortase [Pseudomaricurvus alcaniphilus]
MDKTRLGRACLDPNELDPKEQDRNELDRKELDRVVTIVTATGAAMVVAQYFPQLLQYNRSAILAGEYWRLISAHFTHADGNHLLLNLVGLALVAYLSPHSVTTTRWLVAVLVCGLAISLGLLLWLPELQWYLGMSGVLHGLLAMALILRLYRGQIYCAAGLGLLALKLLLEQRVAVSSYAHPLIELPVITEAHLIGALGGFLIALLLPILYRQRNRRSDTPTPINGLASRPPE